MILYFTGTGNSEYAAKKLAAALGEETMPLMERIRHNDTSPLESETPWIVCTPTYAWQLPHIVRDHLRRTLLRGSKEIYFVMTCGGEIGEAGKYAAELCAEKYLTYRGCARVIMPENYIVMFDVPDEAKARGIVAAADPMLDRLAELIRERKPFPQPKVSAADKLKSGVVNKAFYPLLVHAKQFTVNEKCTGCGLCAKACHEGAIGMVDGKAKLLRDDYCDGLGDCLPACPMDAIHFVEREAAAYNEAAVLAAKAHKAAHTGCPGARMRQMNHGDAPVTAQKRPSQLSQWPCQIKLAPVNAPYFDGCDLLIAADCTAYAYASIHEDFMRGKMTLIGCPKLDAVDYSQKLAAIFAQNDVRSVTLLRMEVPCCGGLEFAAKKAIAESGKELSLRVVTISIEGEILEDA